MQHATRPRIRLDIAALIALVLCLAFWAAVVYVVTLVT